MGLLGQYDPHIIGPYETRFNGEDVDVPGGMNFKAQIPSLYVE